MICTELDKISHYVFARVKCRFLDDPFWVDIGTVKLACYYKICDENFATIVLFHGNGEVVSDYLQNYAALFGLFNVNIFIAEYRGYANSTGTSTVCVCLEDAIRIIRHLKLSPEKTIIFGRSLGSLPAIHTATYFNVHKLIVENEIIDFFNWTRNVLQWEEMERGLADEVSWSDLKKEINFHVNNNSKLLNYGGRTLVWESEDDATSVSQIDNLITNTKGKIDRLFLKGSHNESFYSNVEIIAISLYNFLKSEMPLPYDEYMKQVALLFK